MSRTSLHLKPLDSDRRHPGHQRSLSLLRWNSHVELEEDSRIIEDDETESCCSLFMDDITKGCRNCFNEYVFIALDFLYDSFIFVISIADFITNILVTYSFANNGDNVFNSIFFVISLTILIISNVSYCIAFLYRFCDIEELSKCQLGCMFLLIFSFSPLVPGMFYFTAFDDRGCVFKFLKDCGFVFEKVKIDKNQAPLLIWLDMKLNKHIGFILHGFIESIPQLILQFITLLLVFFDNNIYVYNESRYQHNFRLLLIISFFISFASVISKMAIFVKATDFKIFALNWLSLVADICGAFVLICWYVCIVTKLKNKKYKIKNSTIGQITILISIRSSPN